MNKKIFVSFLTFLSLSACSDPKVVVNRVPLQPTQTARIQQPIYQGFDASYTNHGSEWARYALRVTSGCPVDISDLSSPTNTSDVPVFEGEGHINMVYHKDEYAIYLKPTIRENYKNENTINVLVSSTYKNKRSEFVLSKNITVPEGNYGEGLPATFPVIRFKSSNNAICSVQFTVLPSAGIMSRKIWAQGVGSEAGTRSRTNYLGTPLPQEQGGSSLSDVMHSADGSSSVYRSPDFHDPFNVDQGGMGAMVR